MRPMGHIVDLYISEILNSSVSRHITKVGGGGQDWSRFQRYFSKRKYAPNGHSHSYELYEQHGFFFSMYVYGMLLTGYGTHLARDGSLFFFSHGRRFDKNSCMVCERLYANFK